MPDQTDSKSSETSDYEAQYRFENQTNIIDGIAINPVLRPDFDSTSEANRPKQEIADWWDKPYIVSLTADEHEASGITLRQTLEGISPDPVKISDEAFNIQQNKQGKQFLEEFPSGTRYEVLCLNGGA